MAVFGLTSYDFNPPLYQGQVKSTCRAEIHSGISEVPIPQGIVVVVGSTDELIALPSAAGQSVLGISCFTSMYEPVKITLADNSIVRGYPASVQVPYVRSGIVGVPAETAMSLSDTVYFRHTANGPGKLLVGAIRNDDDTAFADELTSAKVRKPCNAGEICELEINKP